ncbi:integrase core domain-containing protein [Arthrobacter alpinus]|uniref:integrase core domain-containing protein n=1 Tax=Arthrobacter alpinus TaxID=656366 RepID=UPI00147E8F92|nr:integrase core domain-containing protein [Arthrobacter alpinus]
MEKPLPSMEPETVNQRQGRHFRSRKGNKAVFFQERLTALGVEQLHSRLSHPKNCGKPVRDHRSIKDYYADHWPATTIDELQKLCDTFRCSYNLQRPHLPLNQETPGAAYALYKKATPDDTAGSVNYRKRKINIGQAHT